MRALDQSLEALGHARREAQPIEGQEHRRAVEQPHDDRLPVDGGHGGDADVDAPAVGGDPDAPVLREAPLRDVHLGHDLDAGRQRRLQSARGRLHLVEQAVDAVPHPQGVLEGLDVDVGGVARECLFQQQVHQAHHRRLGGHVPQQPDVGVALLGLRLQGSRLHVVDDPLQRGGRLVGALDRGQDGLRGRHAELHAQTGSLAEVVDQLGAAGVHGGHRHRVSLHRHRARHVVAQVLRREPLHQRHDLRDVGRGQERHPQTGRERPELLLGRAPAGGDAHHISRLGHLTHWILLRTTGPRATGGSSADPASASRRAGGTPRSPRSPPRARTDGPPR